MDRDVVMAILGFAIPALIIWIWRLWDKQTKDKEFLLERINELALKLADGYHNKDELRQVMIELLGPMREDIKQLKDEWRSSRNGGVPR